MERQTKGEGGRTPPARSFHLQRRGALALFHNGDAPRAGGVRHGERAVLPFFPTRQIRTRDFHPFLSAGLHFMTSKQMRGKGSPAAEDDLN